MDYFSIAIVDYFSIGIYTYIYSLDVKKQSVFADLWGVFIKFVAL